MVIYQSTRDAPVIVTGEDRTTAPLRDALRV
jgi:hypothetical protein